MSELWVIVEYGHKYRLSTKTYIASYNCTDLFAFNIIMVFVKYQKETIIKNT